jgi:hypothetical protein
MFGWGHPIFLHGKIKCLDEGAEFGQQQEWLAEEELNVTF